MPKRGTNVPPDQRVGLLTDFLRQGQLAWQLMRDPRVASATKVVLPVLAVLYLLSPIDLLPDVFPVLGQMDDLAVLALAVKLFVSLAPPQVVAEHRDNIRRGGKAAPPTASEAEPETVDAEYRVVD